VKKGLLWGVTIYLPSWDDALDRSSRVKYAGNTKAAEASVWNNEKALKKFTPFPPHSTGNKSGSKTWGNMCHVSSVKMLPLRIRNEKGRRYYEFALYFDNPKMKSKNGIWALSEEGAKGLTGKGIGGKPPEFLFFKLKTTKPFCERSPEGKHKEEIENMPDWQKYTEEQVKRFLKTGKLAR
jgi:hypothetical protein